MYEHLKRRIKKKKEMKKMNIENLIFTLPAWQKTLVRKIKK